MATWSTLVETECDRAEFMVRKDHRQRWVTLDGRIHETPVPYRDAISITRGPFGVIVRTYRDRQLAHSAIGAI